MKRKILHLPPYFEVCSICGRHGHIVLSNSTVTREFNDRKDGLEVLFAALVAEQINVGNHDKIVEQISWSSIPEAVRSHPAVCDATRWDVKIEISHEMPAILQ
jgi:hypothetical protein